MLSGLRISYPLIVVYVVLLSIAGTVHADESVTASSAGERFGRLSDAFSILFRERTTEVSEKYGVRDEAIIEDAVRDISNTMAMCMIQAAEKSSDPLARDLLGPGCADSETKCDPAQVGATRLKPVMDALAQDMAPCVQENLSHVRADILKR